MEFQLKMRKKFEEKAKLAEIELQNLKVEFVKVRVDLESSRGFDDVQFRSWLDLENLSAFQI